jgi:hypothetical protein
VNDPDLDDDDVLDDALRALGTPSAARPAATAAAILAAAGAAPAASPVTGSGGFGLGVVGAALLAGLGAGGLLGFGVAAALFAGQTPEAVVAAGAPPVAAGETVVAAGEGVVAAGVGVVAAGFQPAAAEIPEEGSAEPPLARAFLPAAQVGRASVPALAMGPEVQAEPAAGKMPAATTQEPTPEAREIVSDVGIHHEPVRTLGVGLRVTSGGRAWDGTIDGVAPELAASVGVVAGGGPVRPRLRGDLAFGGVDARATAAGAAMVGLASDVGPGRLDVGVAGGMRWIAAKPGAEDPLDAEAGWLVLGAGPSAALVVPRRGGDLFVGGEVLYSWLAFDGAVERVPWFGLTAGVELSPRKSIHGSE